jgi:hypothetical protein
VMAEIVKRGAHSPVAWPTRVSSVGGGSILAASGVRSIDDIGTLRPLSRVNEINDRFRPKLVKLADHAISGADAQRRLAPPAKRPPAAAHSSSFRRWA